MIDYKHIIVLEIFALSCTFMNMFTDTDTHHKLARGSYHTMRYNISVPTSEGASGNGWWRLGCWICPVRKEGRVLRLCEGDIVERSVCVCFALD